MFRANLQRTGVHQTKGLANFHRVKWRFQTGKEVNTSPIIVDDWIYFGSTDGYCYVLNLHTSEERWKFHSGRQGGVYPTIDEQTLYCEGATSIYALDRNTGQERRNWHQDYGVGSPAIVDGILYFGSITGLNAFDVKNGRIWKIITGSWVPHPPTFANSTLYFGGFDHYLYAVNIRSGKKRRVFKTGWHISMCPAILQDVIYFSSEDRIFYALDMSTGQIIWKFVAGSIITASAVTEEIICFGVWDGRFLALDRQSGQERWKFRTEGTVPAHPCIADGIVYFGDGDFHDKGGRVYALDLETGQELWRFETTDRIWSYPIIADGILYFGSGDGCLYAIE